MNSINDWTINGLVTKSKVTESGLWLTVKGKAFRKGLFVSDRMVFTCFISNSVARQISKAELKAKGKFEINESGSYFVISKIL